MDRAGKKRTASQLSDEQESRQRGPNLLPSSSVQHNVPTVASVEPSESAKKIIDSTIEAAKEFGLPVITSGEPFTNRGLLRILLEYIADEYHIVLPQKPEVMVKSQALQSKLILAWTNESFEAIVNELKPPTKKAKLHRKSNSDQIRVSTQAERAATVGSWTQPYKGKASEVLWAYIKHTFRQDINGKPLYGQYLSVINSSGMGKSRMVDELSKNHFVIPINLRVRGATGYPPADDVVRDFLTERATQGDAADHASAFFAALFEKTAEHIDAHEWNGDIPAEFREQLSQGQTMHKVGPFRRDFFQSVVARARKMMDDPTVFQTRLSQGPMSLQSDEVRSQGISLQAEAVRDDEDEDMHMPPSTPPNPPRQNPPRQLPLSPPRPDKLKGFPVRFFQKLQQSLAAQHFRESPKEPLVTIAFDEVHTLIEKQSGDDVEESSKDSAKMQSGDGVEEESEDDTIDWSRYGELRRVLHDMRDYSLFALFLSTTGKISQLAPSSHVDFSERIVGLQFSVIPPFTELGMDQLAAVIVINEEGQAYCLIRNNTQAASKPLTLEEVTHPKYMAHLGRPLFGSRYDHGDNAVRDTIVMFAAHKLIAVREQLPDDLDPAQKMACLSQRLCLEFNSTNYSAHLAERAQVEGHLRVCLKISHGSETMVSTSASEPLLSQAAVYIMLNTLHFKAPAALQSVLGGFAIHQGDRGELVVSMLLTIARDNAAGNSSIRVIMVNDFMDALVLPPGNASGEDHEDVLDMIQPPPPRTSRSSSTAQQEEEAEKSFRQTFKNARFHFNHFIKVHEEESITMERLLAYLIRGAGVLCANGQPGIDGVIAFLMDNLELNLSQLGVMLWQVKNDQTYTHVPKWYMFDSMDPFKLGIYPGKAKKNTQSGKAAGPSTPWKSPPVIRIFFALAAKTPSLRMQKGEFKSKVAGATFTAFDIWCAGISPDILAPIHASGANVWNSLLQASYGWNQTYKGDIPAQEDLRRTMNPGAGTNDHHFNHWIQLPKGFRESDKGSVKKDGGKTSAKKDGSKDNRNEA